MRKLEGMVKEVVDEMDYLKKREERFTGTNGTSPSSLLSHILRSPNFANVVISPILSPFRCGTESTNTRVTHFGLFTFVALVCLGVWEIFHLRSFFKRKYLID